MQSVVLLLGSNLGDRAAMLAGATALISGRVGRVVGGTSMIGTEAVGYQSKCDYLNQIVVVETQLGPMDVLDTVLQIERELGRTNQRTTRCEAITDRTIDIDLLYYIEDTLLHKKSSEDSSPLLDFFIQNSIRLDSPRLTLPHPEIPNRQFVLDLLSQVALQ